MTVVNTSNVVSDADLTEIDYNERDADGTPIWIRNTGPKVGVPVKSKKPSMRSYPQPGAISKEEARRMAAEAVRSFPITRID